MCFGVSESVELSRIITKNNGTKWLKLYGKDNVQMLEIMLVHLSKLFA